MCQTARDHLLTSGAIVIFVITPRPRGDHLLHPVPSRRTDLDSRVLTFDYLKSIDQITVGEERGSRSGTPASKGRGANW